MWEMFSGTFEPAAENHYGFFRNINSGTIDRIEKEVFSEKNRMVCANDGEYTSDDDFPVLQKRMAAIMEKKYPKKSAFEL